MSRPDYAYVGDCCVGTIGRADADTSCVCGVRWVRVPGLGWTAEIDWDDYDRDPLPRARLSRESGDLESGDLVPGILVPGIHTREMQKRRAAEKLGGRQASVLNKKGRAKQ